MAFVSSVKAKSKNAKPGKEDKKKKAKPEPSADALISVAAKRSKKAPEWIGEATPDAKGRMRAQVTLPNTGEKIGAGGLCQLWGFCGGTVAGITALLSAAALPQMANSIRKRVSVGILERENGTWVDRPRGYGPAPTGGKGKKEKPTDAERKDRKIIEKLIAEWE